MPAVRPRFHLTPCSEFRGHLNSRQLHAGSHFQCLFCRVKRMLGYGQLAASPVHASER
jgi:hypothetical protein